VPPRPNRKKQRIERIHNLWDKIAPVPTHWLEKPAENKQDIEPIFCDNFADVEAAWNEAFEFTDGMRTALICMLATASSTDTVGAQLWLKLVGPPSCGKSLLCEAISVADKYVRPVSKFTGFVSGIKEKNGEDNSFVKELGGKTMVLKEGDTLLQMLNLSEILSEARDIWDGVIRTSYRSGQQEEYKGIRFTWIAAFTSAVIGSAVDSADLGARFLTCIIADGVDEELEKKVARRASRNALAGSRRCVTTDLASHKNEAHAKADALTGGYLLYLRDNIEELISEESVEMSEDYMNRCEELAKMVSYLRARASKRQTEVAERELCARLSEQFVRMSLFAAVVLNKPVVDEEVEKIIHGLAANESRGVMKDIFQYLYDNGDATTQTIAALLDVKDSEARTQLNFLYKLDAVEKGKRGAGYRWNLSDPLYDLYNITFGENR